jgi:acetyl-CoA carboxylase, biotin carboxylase subunit
VLGDKHGNVIYLGERECSIQRRNQKVIEEAPSPLLDEATRRLMGEQAVALAKAVGYDSAGTVEFVAGQDKSFYFLEMNTRLQVEHPVTEMITGIDLVKAMLAIAGGAALPYRQSDISMRGHAVEVRINAEDPAKGFLPGPGRVSGLGVPTGEGIRFDTMLYEGYAVPPFYDSLLGKLIAWGETRIAAIDRLRTALADLTIEGLPTTRVLHLALADAADVRAGAVHTRWLEGWLAAGLPTNDKAA